MRGLITAITGKNEPSTLTNIKVITTLETNSKFLMVFGYVAEGKKKKQNIARRFLEAMKEGDFVTVSLAIGLDHQYLIEVNSLIDTRIFNITLEEELKERCMIWGADHSIITTFSYIRIMNSYLVSIDGRLAFDTILLFCSGNFGVQSHN